MHGKKNIKSECEYVGLKNNRLNYRCKECNGKSSKSVNDLIETFPGMYKFCNGNLNKFVTLLRKCAYPYLHMDSWEKFNGTSLPAKKDFYCELTLEDIVIKTKNMLKKYLKNIAQIWVIIMICMFKLIHFFLQMFLKNLEKNALKYMDLILHILF